MKEVDVTSLVDFDWPDGESLPLTKCICGSKWSAWSGPILSVDREWTTECSECGRKFYWKFSARVLEVLDG